MSHDIGAHHIEAARRQFRGQQRLAEAALAQTDDAAFFAAADAEANSIALICKHMSGNMRSRWTDFLGTDGEKPDRRRDAEFEREASDTREQIMARWEDGWACVFAAVDALAPDDLRRTVTIRGEPHTVLQALQRQLAHYAYDIGQIVQLARHAAGPRWKSLSIPRGQSAQFEVSKDGNRYRAEPGTGASH